MSFIRIIVVAVLVCSMGFLGPNVFAADSGVIKLEVPDAAAVGMGGAFTGEADRPSAVYYNPAGITQIGTEVSAGITFLQPQIEHKSSTAGNGDTSDMNRDNYIFPHVYVSTPVFKDKLFIGIGENSNFGGGNDWAANSFSRYSTVKDSLVDQSYMIVGAYKINDQWSVGAGAIDDQSKFEHDQALAQANGTDGDALFKANDNAWGFTLGSLFKLNDKNQFGLTYKSPIHHVYNGTLYMNNLNSSPTFGPLGFGGFGGYSDVFGGSSFSTKAIQKLTLPQSVTLGYSFKPTSKWKINFDLEWTDWSNTVQQTTYYPDVNPLQAAILATGNPQQRSWRSVWAESLGAEYALRDNFRIRGGYDHHQSPVPKGTYDTEFPDANYNAVTTGFGYDITKNITLDIAYVAVFYQSRNINNAQGAALGANLNGKYSEFVNIGTATLTYKF